MKKIYLITFLILPVALCAQNNKNWLIKTGKLFDSETAQFKTGLDILVKDGRIEDVKPDVDITADQRKQYTLIDLSNSTVLPGLIDAHTHLLYREGNSGNGPNTSTIALERHLTMDGDAYRALYGAARAKGYLEAGITSVQDLGNSGMYGDIALRKAIADRLLPGPNMSCAGPGLAAAGAQMPGLLAGDQHLVDGEYRIVSGVDDAVQAVREHVNQTVNVIKIYADNRPNRTFLSVEEMRAIVNEAHRYHLRVTAHATVDESIKNAVLAGVDCIEHGYNVSDSTLMLMASHKVMLVPTDGDKSGLVTFFMTTMKDTTGMDARVTRNRKYYIDRLQRALKFGVTIAYGSDDYAESKLPFGEPSKHNLIGYTEAGVPIPQVLQIATRNSARQLNWGKYLGIIKKGYLPDIIAVDNSIDKDIHAIMDVKFVMKGGVVYVNK
ncbi:amidohydrolase family protein [Mucilaginibacter sp. UR6-11]|uniref:amidohydrolase family protein n=1 Tax=Mucilaginibacter sp. UR6-11 TaxID=1435644 RepID=UPI001E5045AF|nr:amidohydrolase family protein [Mucilaginibacter sp. UR6-11]MCC8426086.1 amidohydrolase family protein [Mucilaginibacter sp. UR6-11]